MSGAISSIPAEIHAGGWKELDLQSGEVVHVHKPAGHDVSNPNNALRDSAIAFAPWHPAAAVIRREVVVANCLWDEHMNRMVTEDTVFWWRLIACHRVAIHKICGVRYRRGTPGCRDQFRDPEKWSQGLFYALTSNVDFWVALGNTLTSGQVANLVRVYESFGAEAQRTGAKNLSAESFRRADTLLAQGIWTSPSARLRRILGTRLFTRFRHVVSR
jgi:hypothetical protein